MHTLLCRSSRCKVCRVSTERGVLWGFCCGTLGKATLLPWASLLHVDKIISEVTED